MGLFKFNINGARKIKLECADHIFRLLHIRIIGNRVLIPARIMSHKRRQIYGLGQFTGDGIKLKAEMNAFGIFGFVLVNAADIEYAIARFVGKILY